MVKPSNKSSSKSKTKMKIYNTKEAKRVVERNGWKLIRTKGDHFYYKKEGDQKVLGISDGMNKYWWEKIIDKYNLDLDA